MAVVHTLIVMDMANSRILKDECHEYAGEWSLCGGSKSTTNTVDYAYNAWMATLSEEQQEWAREYFQVWQQFQKPYEIAQSQSNLEVLPMETSVYKRQLDYASWLLMTDMTFLQAQNGEAQSLIPPETALAHGQLEQATRLLPVESQLYESQIAASAEILPASKAMYELSLENAADLMPKESELYTRQLLEVDKMLPKESLERSQKLFKICGGINACQRGWYGRRHWTCQESHFFGRKSHTRMGAWRGPWRRRGSGRTE